MKEFILIEAPSNLGLAEPAPGVEPGVKLFPAAMEKAGFVLSGSGKKMRIQAPGYSIEVDPESKVRNANKLVVYSRHLADALYTLPDNRNIPVIIGGDCSVLIGAALSLKKRKGDYALFFLDGHTDYVSPEQSGSAGAAGMDLAIVAGKGHDKLTNIEGLKPYFKEENIFCCGNRDLSEDWYVNEIAKSNIHYFSLYVLREKGIDEIVNEFFKLVNSKKLDGFWIHFDVDVLNDEIMPCVDSRQKDGLSYKELHEVLDPLIQSEFFQGIDITIFDPTLDKEGIYAKQLAAQLTNLFSTHRMS